MHIGFSLLMILNVLGSAKLFSWVLSQRYILETKVASYMSNGASKSATPPPYLPTFPQNRVGRVGLWRPPPPPPPLFAAIGELGRGRRVKPNETRMKPKYWEVVDSEICRRGVIGLHFWDYFGDIFWICSHRHFALADYTKPFQGVWSSQSGQCSNICEEHVKTRWNKSASAKVAKNTWPLRCPKICGFIGCYGRSVEKIQYLLRNICVPKPKNAEVSHNAWVHNPDKYMGP